MIRQLCPHCLAGVDLPADAPGTAAPCPNCGKPIPVPAGYAPAVAAEAPPAPPPGFVPPRPAADAPPPAAPGTPPTAVPAWVAWLPAAGLLAALLASLFPWVGSFPAGERLFTQTPWQAAAGTFGTGVLIRDLLTLANEPGLRAAVRTSWWLVPYLPLLLGGVALAWAERLVPGPPRPAWAARLWPHRFALLAGLAALLLLLAGVQALAGFGLEHAAGRAAVTQVAADTNPDVVALRGKADSASQFELRVRAAFEANKLGLETTPALGLALLAHLLAAAGAAGRWWLVRRGDRPLPRLQFVR